MREQDGGWRERRRVGHGRPASFPQGHFAFLLVERLWVEECML